MGGKKLIRTQSTASSGSSRARLTEENSQISETLFQLYLSTCEGKFCTSVDSVTDLEVLISKGYVEVTECNKDSRSKHGAKTCRVKLLWLTDKGKEFGRQGSERYYQTIGDLSKYLGECNPRISALAKYMISSWAARIIAGQDYIIKYRSPRRGGWNMLTLFEWDVKAPNDYHSLLPENVKDELKGISDKLVELKLADYNSLGHNVNGWYKTETLMTTIPIARSILREYGGFDLPYFLKSFMMSISRASMEAELAREIEAGGTSLYSIIGYLNYGCFFDLVDFLRFFEDLGYADVDWHLIDEYARPKIRYDVGKFDELNKAAVTRRLYGFMPSVSAITYTRFNLAVDIVRNAISKWFENGSLSLVEIPPLKIIWTYYKTDKLEDWTILERETSRVT